MSSAKKLERKLRKLSPSEEWNLIMVEEVRDANMAIDILVEQLNESQIAHIATELYKTRMELRDLKNGVPKAEQ